MSAARRVRLPLLALALVAALYGWWSWGEGMGQPFGDGPAYLMQAQHYAGGRAADPVYAEASTYSRFPPLYPLLLAASGGAAALPLAHLATCASLVLALGVFLAWLRLERLDPDLALLLMLGVAALPGTWLAALSIQSEYLYLLLSLLSLLLMRHHQKDGGGRVLLAAALAVGAASLARTVGITLLPPLLLLLWRAPRRTAVPGLLLALLPPMAWQLLHHTGVGYGDSLGVYGGDVFGRLHSQLALELPALRQGLLANFLRFPALRLPADVLGLVCLAATVRRAAALRTDAVYLLAYLGVLLLWPYPEEAPRLLWAVLPVLLAQPLLWLAAGLEQTSRPRRMLAAAAALLLAMTLPGLLHAVDRYHAAAHSEVPQAASYVAWYGLDPEAAEEETTMHYVFLIAMQALPEYVPAEDCVLAIRPELVNYYGHRASRYPPLDSLPDPEFAAAVQQTGCRYALGVSGKDRRFPAALHPLPRLGGKAVPIFRSTLHSEISREDVLVALLVRLER